MKTWIGLIILVVLYISFVFGEGIFYDISLRTIDWLNEEHGRKGYLGWMALIFVAASYLLFMEKMDKKKEESATNELIKAIKETGVHAEKTQNSGFGDAHVKAIITFQDSGFVLLIKQNANLDNEAVLDDKKFLSWKELSNYIKLKTIFSLHDFMTNTDHNLQQPQNTHG